MKIKNLLLLIMVLAVPCFAEEYVIGVSGNRVGHGTASYKKMSARLDYDAVKFREAPPVPRIIEFDSAFGADLEEHEKLNTYGVLMVTAQCRNPKELPLKSVYLKKDGKKYPLKCLLQKQVQPGSALAEKTFGSYRYDAFYLIPYGYTKVSGELCADWNTNRENFLLVKYPLAYNLIYARNKKGLRPVKGKSIDKETLKALLIRELYFLPEEAEKAVEGIK